MRHTPGYAEASADCKSAIQQVANLRYFGCGSAELGPVGAMAANSSRVVGVIGG
jgi:hypothetical protein